MKKIERYHINKDSYDILETSLRILGNRLRDPDHKKGVADYINFNTVIDMIKLISLENESMYKAMNKTKADYQSYNTKTTSQFITSLVHEIKRMNDIFSYNAIVIGNDDISKAIGNYYTPQKSSNRIDEAINTANMQIQFFQSAIVMMNIIRNDILKDGNILNDWLTEKTNHARQLESVAYSHLLEMVIIENKPERLQSIKEKMMQSTFNGKYGIDAYLDPHLDYQSFKRNDGEKLLSEIQDKISPSLSGTGLEI